MPPSSEIESHSSLEMSSLANRLEIGWEEKGRTGGDGVGVYVEDEWKRDESLDRALWRFFLFGTQLNG
jgi:hypothetical protein